MAEREDTGIKCWGCGAEAPGGDLCRRTSRIRGSCAPPGGGALSLGDLCPECGRLQPFPAGADHWAVLGLPRRLVLDRADLERRFHQLNRRFHPDYFRLRSPREQAISLDNSAAVNTAYRILRDPVSRVEYLLGQEGLGLGQGGRGAPPADLFEEIMELQEAREELRGADPEEARVLRARLEAARADLEARRAATEPRLLELSARWDGAPDGARRALLAELRDLLATRAYLRAVLRDLDEALGGA